ncbi:DENN domain-containing protein 1B isoform X1 [Pleurodeles waltl]|uniref:DENN domain-containing protein 1B isoform X1 n=1 Tax=Pleurodeles waltl TaxID=8319 RepID=UPI0037096497
MTMDCRIKENPERTFDLVLKVECPASENEEPVVLWKFPEEFKDQEVLQSVPKFCFPFAIERLSQNQVGQHFTFVLTDIESKQSFGFCRLTSGGKVCLCILSYLPWFEVYYKLLNTLSDYLIKEQENDLNDMLGSLYNHPVPKANTPVNLSVSQQVFISSEQIMKTPPSPLLHSYFITPDVTGLPTIPESRNLTEYFVAVDVNNMLQLYASMMHERRIIITSSKLSTLTACVHASVALLYPMYWQHIYIPVLPPHLLDYCCAPMPYLIGVHFSLIERVKNRSLEDVVLLNIDTNTLETPFSDLSDLPSEVVSALKSKLKKQSTATGDGVARAFLRAQAALFGSYRDALRYKPGERITFCEGSFVKHRSSTTKHFLETAVNLQLFKQFIDGRLTKLNAGRGFTDAFEEEITLGGFSGGNPKSYREWMYTVKKGGALINTAMTKATPAVKTAYKFAKTHAKQGIREVKSKLKQKESDEDGASPSSTPALSTQVNSSNRPRRANSEKRRLGQLARLNHPQKHISHHDSPLDDDDEMDSVSKLSSEDSEETSGYFYDSDESGEPGTITNHRGEMDLLGEILDTLSIHSSDQGRLSGAKSLDFFRSLEDIDYKAKEKSSAPSENNLSLLCGGTSDQLEWHLGQDDCALHGKQLPPSPRKRVSHHDLSDPIPTVGEEISENNLYVKYEKLPMICIKSSSPAGSVGQLSSMEDCQSDYELFEQNGILNQTLKSPLVEQIPLSAGRCTSTQVPWEKEQDAVHTSSVSAGLLDEVVALCQFTSDFQQTFNIHNENGSTRNSGPDT